MRSDRLDENGNETSREVMTHAGNNCEGRTRNLGCGVPASFDGNERIVCPVKDKGRKGKLLEHLDARAACHDRGELTSSSRRIVGSVEGRADLGPQFVVRRRESLTSDLPVDPHAVLNRQLAVAAIRTALHDRGHRFGFRLRQSGVATR